jgi:hypothetical protein
VFIRKLIWLLVLVLGFSAAAQSGDDPADYNFVGIQVFDLPEVDMVISPDGKVGVASHPIHGDEICLYRFELTSQEPLCLAKPEGFLGRLGLMYWSPDSRYIAFHEDFSLDGNDSDIWLLDTETLAIINLTDDGYEGAFLQENVPLDHLPMWHPITGDLYFFRLYFLEAGLWSLALFRTERADNQFSEPEIVFDLSDEMPLHPLSIREFAPISLGGGAEISPDGDHIALLTRANPVEESIVLLLDMETGSLSELTSIVLLSGLPYYGVVNPQEYVFDSLGWANHGEGLVIVIRHPDPNRAINPIIYYLDLEGNPTPLLDFSADETDLNASASMDFDRPAATVLSIDTTLLFYISAHRRTGLVGVSALRLPPDHSVPVRLTFLEDSRIATSRQNSIGDDGQTIRMALGGHLLTFERGD